MASVVAFGHCTATLIAFGSLGRFLSLVMWFWRRGERAQVSATLSQPVTFSLEVLDKLSLWLLYAST